ncbi:MAG TPA: AtpZ/AtpI family protein [Caulobacteraceae bacterium]|jgi:ATP synthase protein I
MPKSEDPGPDPFGRLDERLAAFEADRRKSRPGLDLGLGAMSGAGAGASAGYRMVAQLLGGVFGGVGLGWLLDHFAHTRPFGLVGGLLIGVTMALVTTIRTATRASARTQSTTPPAPRAPDDDDDDE